MASQHTNWRTANEAAQTLACKTGLNVALRRVKEFGRIRYIVSFASNDGSDLARAEIIKPTPA